MLKGRPRLQLRDSSNYVVLMRPFFSHSKATFLIDMVAIKWHHSNMPSSIDVVRRMQYELNEELREMKKSRDELAELRAYQARIETLNNAIERGETRIRELVGVLGDTYVEFAGKAGLLQTGHETLNWSSPKEIQTNTPLWVALREYLRLVNEAKIAEIQSFMQIVGVENVGRTAIESAVRRHPEVFKVIKRGHERWLSLRKESNASSTKQSRK